MFGIGFWEIMLVGLIAFIVIKPQQLPEASYRVGKLFQKVKQIAHEIKQQWQMPNAP